MILLRVVTEDIGRWESGKSEALLWPPSYVPKEEGAANCKPLLEQAKLRFILNNVFGGGGTWEIVSHGGL